MENSPLPGLPAGGRTDRKIGISIIADPIPLSNLFSAPIRRRKAIEKIRYT